QQAGLLEQGLGGEVERVGEAFQDPDRRRVQAPLELAEIGVRDLGSRGKLAKRELRELALGVDEVAEGLDLPLPGIGAQAAGVFPENVFSSTGAAAATIPSANSRCASSSCSAKAKLVRR